ncbi:uncharacterized protein LOC143997444 isoform X1 [Lithobates pipiens]
MAAIEHVLERLRAQAEVRGSEWLTEQVERWMGETEAGTSSGEPVLRARRSRPPARFSPGPAPRPPRDRRSPGADRSVPPAKRRQQDDRGLGRSARRRPTPGGGATGQDGAGSPPSSPATVRVGDPCGGPCTSRGTASGAEGSARRTESAYRGTRAVGGGRRADAGLLDGQTGGLTPRGGAGGRPRSGSLRQSGSKAPVVKDLPSHLLAAASGSGSPRGLLAPAEREEEDRSEGELSAEDDVVPPAVESGNAAAGRVPGRPDGGSPRLVWIVGHSYVCWGARRGDMRPAGRQLGISRAEAELRWLGIPGMRWERVVSVVERFVWLHGPPDVLVLHAGGNDLGARKVRDLLNDIKADFLKLRARFPSTILLWSDIVARTQWRWARSVASIQKTRIRVNKVVGRFVIQNGGLVIRHRELESNVGLYLRGDGVHLTDVGIDLWSLGLQGGIQQALRVWGCPQG